MKKGLLFLILIALVILAFIFVPKKQDQVAEEEGGMLNTEVMIDGDVRGASDEMMEVSTQTETSLESETTQAEVMVEVVQ